MEKIPRFPIHIVRSADPVIWEFLKQYGPKVEHATISNWQQYNFFRYYGQTPNTGHTLLLFDIFQGQSLTHALRRILENKVVRAKALRRKDVLNLED
jgi:hypothetical protein